MYVAAAVVCVFLLGSFAPTIALYSSDLDSRNLTVAEVIEVLFQNYSDRVRPDVDLQKPTEVKFNVYINSISSINEIAMDFTLNIYLRQYWRDHRLQFSKKYGQISLNAKDVPKLWVPDAFFPDEREAKLHMLTVPNLLVFLEPDGSVYFSQRLTLILRCDMSLNIFPFDSQKCLITIETFASKTTELLFSWTVKPYVDTANVSLPEFELNPHIPTFNCTRSYISGVYPCLSFELTLTRMIGYFLVQNYVPSILIVILSWVSFWIDIEAVPARISLGLLTVLTMTTQTSGVHARLPRVSYVKAIDVWMTCCMIFVFAALVEFSIVNVLARQDQKRKIAKQKKMKEQESSALRNIVEETAYSNITNSVMQFGPRRRNNGVIHPNVVSVANGRQESVSSAEEPPKNNDNPDEDDGGMALLCDKISRIVFPLVYSIFNITYWSTYLLLRRESW